MIEPPKVQWGKSIFVFAVVAFCLGVSARMGFDQTLTTKVSEIVADGLISLAMFVAVSFLAAQTVDMSGVLTKVGDRLGKRGVTTPPPVPLYETVDPRDPTDSVEAKG